MHLRGKMSQQGAALQCYNNELVACIEELCYRRDLVQKEILSDEEQKTLLEQNIRELNEQLSKVNKRLSDRVAVRDEYDKVITEAKDAYVKILQSSQTLLDMVKTESVQLSQKMRPAQKEDS